MGILQPLVALALWTMVMWVWMYATRIPAMITAKIDADRTARDPDYTLDRILEPEVKWKAQNYTHLHEAPTVFYAIALALALLGQGEGLNLWLGWAYVGLRVVHSLVQAIANKVTVRFAIFVLSSLVLFALILRAGLAVIAQT